MVQPIKIYVGNVPTSARNSELKELFEKFGKVIECDILKEFAFVHMDDTNDAKAAIAGLNDTLWKGSRIRVELSTTKTNKGEPSQRYKGDRHNNDRGRRRSVERGRDRYDLANNGFFPPRGTDLAHFIRDGPFDDDRVGLPYRSGRSGAGPIRDSRYSTMSNGRPHPSERSRPYPDSYDQRYSGRSYPGSRGSMRPLPPRGYEYPIPSPYRGGSGDLIRDGGRNGDIPYGDPYMRPPHMHPQSHLHVDNYRGQNLAPHRYDFEYGPPPSSSSRGSRYASPPPPPIPISNSSYSRSGHRSSQLVLTPPSHSHDHDSHFNNRDINRYMIPQGSQEHSSSRSNNHAQHLDRRHSVASSRSSSPPAQRYSSSSRHNGKSKETFKTKISSNATSNNNALNTSSSSQSSNASSVKHESKKSSRQSRSRKQNGNKSKKNHSQSSASPAQRSTKKSSSRQQRSSSSRSRSRSSNRSSVNAY